MPGTPGNSAPLAPKKRHVSKPSKRGDENPEQRLQLEKMTGWSDFSAKAVVTMHREVTQLDVGENSTRWSKNNCTRLVSVIKRSPVPAEVDKLIAHQASVSAMVGQFAPLIGQCSGESPSSRAVLYWSGSCMLVRRY
jgi:hypothetical protein